MKIKEAIQSEKGNAHIHITMAELKTLINMQRVKVINCNAVSRPHADINDDLYYPMQNIFQINRKQANIIVDDRLNFERIKEEIHYERIYISKWRNNRLYISI
tara:strand:- start:160 stop:468 length:309 start_codon:yes stop_codon:yes gene_type:complete